MSTTSNEKSKICQEKSEESSCPKSRSLSNRSRNTFPRNPLDETSSHSLINRLLSRSTVAESKGLYRESVHSASTLTESSEAGRSDPHWIHPLLLIEASKNYRETVLRDRSTSVPPPSQTSVVPSNDMESEDPLDYSFATGSQSEGSIIPDSSMANSASLTVVHTSPMVSLRSILKRPVIVGNDGRCGDTVPSIDKKVQWWPEVDVICYAGDSVVENAGDAAIERTRERLGEEHIRTTRFNRVPGHRIGSIDRCPFEDPCPLQF